MLEWLFAILEEPHRSLESRQRLAARFENYMERFSTEPSIYQPPALHVVRVDRDI